jgi:DNA modification methylase
MENRLLVPVHLLKFNELNSKIYLEKPTNYNEIKNSIKSFGIIEDLLVDPVTNIVISGNIRLRIAMELGIEKVPVIYRSYDTNRIETISINSNQQRQKSLFELSNEIDYLNEYYPVGQGARSDKDRDKRKNKEIRKTALKSHSKDKIEKLTSIKKWCKELYTEEDWNEIFKKKVTAIDEGRSSLNGIFKSIQNEKMIKQNSVKFPIKKNLKRDNVVIYHRSSQNMPEVKDKFVDLILTSPPYFELIDYSDFEQKQSGDKGLGWGDVNEYLGFLLETFKECKRVMKDNASLVVNLNDSKKNGRYYLVPHLFVCEMNKLGFDLVDEYLWLKINPQYNMTKGSVRSHEYIFHFVKQGCKNFYFDDSWLQGELDEFGIYKYGNDAKFPKLFSGFDPRLKVLKTTGSTPSSFKRFCLENELHFYNHGTFGDEIPNLFIKSLVDKTRSGVVMDCYSGSAQTGKVANQLGHSYIGFEVNYDYILASELRIFGNFEDDNLRSVA